MWIHRLFRPIGRKEAVLQRMMARIVHRGPDMGGAYVDEDVSNRVIRIVQSYTEVVNRMVWRKG